MRLLSFSAAKKGYGWTDGRTGPNQYAPSTSSKLGDIKKLFFPFNGKKNKKNIYFFFVNTKNNLSHVFKISAISLMLCTREITVFFFFSTYLMNYIWYSPLKSVFPLCTSQNRHRTAEAYIANFTAVTP